MPSCDPLINPLTTNDNYNCHPNLAACYLFVQSILKISSERVGQRDLGKCHLLDDRSSMAAVAAVCRKAFVSTGRGIFHLSCTYGHRKSSFHLVGASSFQFRRTLSGWTALTIECSLMSGFGQHHELAKKNISKKLEFPGLTLSRSWNTGQRMCH